MACKMVKKGLVGVGIGAAALGLLFGGRAPGYVRTAFHKVRHDARRAVPIEFEIEHARDAVARPRAGDAGRPREHRPHRGRGRGPRSRGRGDPREPRRRSARRSSPCRDNGLKSGEYRVSEHVSYTPEEVKAELARRMDRYSYGKQILEKKESILKSRRQAVAAAREHLKKMAAAEADPAGPDRGDRGQAGPDRGDPRRRRVQLRRLGPGPRPRRRRRAGEARRGDVARRRPARHDRRQGRPGDPGARPRRGQGDRRRVRHPRQAQAKPADKDL